MVRVRFSKSKSAGVKASSSPSRMPHHYPEYDSSQIRAKVPPEGLI